MEIIIQPDSGAASALAARTIARLVREKPHAVLGFATGSSPIETYRNLVEMARREKLDFDDITAFALDEFVGLDPSHPASYHAFLRKHLFDGLKIEPSRTHIPDGLASDIPLYCRHFEDEIRTAGGIDLQILGIGVDGHIGFNEPSSSLASRTRIKTLATQTRRDNAAGFGGEDNVPKHVITMGIGTIMECRMILLLAFGRKKAPAIAEAVEGPVTAMVPASILQMHPHAVILIDEEAASELKRAPYYRWVYDNKPSWQKP